MQSYGNLTEWLVSNKDIVNYLTAIKSDPYFDKNDK